MADLKHQVIDALNGLNIKKQGNTNEPATRAECYKMVEEWKDRKFSIEDIVIRDETKSLSKFKIYNRAEYTKWIETEPDVDHHEVIMRGVPRKLFLDFDLNDDTPMDDPNDVFAEQCPIDKFARDKMTKLIKRVTVAMFPQLKSEDVQIAISERNRNGKYSYHFIVSNLCVDNHTIHWFWLENIRSELPRTIAAAVDMGVAAEQHNFSVTNCKHKYIKLKPMTLHSMQEFLITSTQDCRLLPTPEEYVLLPIERKFGTDHNEDWEQILKLVANKIPYWDSHEKSAVRENTIKFKRLKASDCELCKIYYPKIGRPYFPHEYDNTMWLMVAGGKIYEKCYHAPGEKRELCDAPIRVPMAMQKAYDWLWNGDRGFAIRFAATVADRAFVTDREAGAGYIWSADKLLYARSVADDFRNMIGNVLTPQIKPVLRELLEWKGASDKKVMQAKIKEVNGRLLYIQSTAGQRNIFTQAKISLYNDKFEDKVQGAPDCIPLLGGMLLNFRTWEFRKRTVADFYYWESKAKLLPEDHKCENAMNFLKQVFLNNDELLKFAVTRIALGLTAERLREINLLYGEEASNAKSSIIGALTAMAAPVVRMLSKEVFIKSKGHRSAGSHTSHLMPLRNARAGITSEINVVDQMDSAQIKQMSGADMIAARACYGRDEVTFECLAKLYLLLNFLPEFSADDQGLLDRLCIITFGARFVENPKKANEFKKDPTLEKKLQTEYLDEMFTVFARHLREWYAGGKTIVKPECVKIAIKAATAEIDRVAEFMDDCVVKEADARAPIPNLYAAFKLWGIETGYKIDMTATAFTRSLTKKNYEMKKTGCKYIVGYRVKSAKEFEQERSNTEKKPDAANKDEKDEKTVGL